LFDDFEQIKIPEAAVSPFFVQMSFFDVTYRKFFGHTWIGPGVRAGSHELNYDESVFFCTPFTDEHILIIVEVVAHDKDGNMQSFGWSFFKPFSTSEEFARR
jgi:hypothetical protein